MCENKSEDNHEVNRKKKTECGFDGDAIQYEKFMGKTMPEKGTQSSINFLTELHVCVHFSILHGSNALQ